MKTLALGIVALGAMVAVAVPANATPNTKCDLVTPVEEVSSLAQVPPALRSLVSPIADVGTPFNSTDAVTDPSLPFRRMIRAGHRGNEWFIWYEHGGIAYFWQVVVARVSADGDGVGVLANAETISDTLCAVTDGVFAGRVPPYPEGAWAAGGY